MPSIMDEDIEHTDSKFHKELIGNVDGLIEHLEQMVTLVDSQDAGNDDHHKKTKLWDKTNGRFNAVLGGLQAFSTGLHVEYSNLKQEGAKIEAQQKVLEAERDDLMEKSHELHCRIQYNALETKLDQSFSDMERFTSVESAKCFREEAQENLRRTNEIHRTASLRKCLLDKEILNEMEQTASMFQDYQKERQTYVKELDLFDEVRRRKISLWLNDSNRSDEEREMGERVIEFLDLSSRRRQMEPKIISNTLRMHSMNESLTFDLQDNRRRQEEMTSLQKKIDAMSGLNNVLPRTAAAVTDLSGTSDNSVPSCSESEQSGASTSGTAKDDDAYSAFRDGRDIHHVTSGTGLHRCPRNTNLVTDPVTDPELLVNLESALRWEVNDGLELSTVDGSVEATTDNATPITTSQDLPDPASTKPKQTGSGSGQEEENENVEEEEQNEETGGGSAATSVCGDAVSQEKLPVDEASVTRRQIGLDNVVNSTTTTAPPRSSHLLLHHVESATGLIGSSDKQLMFGLVKRKSSGGPSSMTAIADGEREADRMMSPFHRQNVAADARETRSQSQGWMSFGGRTGSSGTSNNSGNPRNSREHIIEHGGTGRGGGE